VLCAFTASSSSRSHAQLRQRRRIEGEAEGAVDAILENLKACAVQIEGSLPTGDAVPLSLREGGAKEMRRERLYGLVTQVGRVL